MYVFEKIRTFIDTRGIDPVSLAEAAGIPPAIFSAILQGKKKLYADELKAICIALDLPVSNFVDSQGKGKKQDER